MDVYIATSTKDGIICVSESYDRVESFIRKYYTDGGFAWRRIAFNKWTATNGPNIIVSLHEVLK